MNDLISRSALLEDICKSVVFSGRSGETSAEMRGAHKVTDRIKVAPAIEQPTWISVDERLPTEGASIEMFFPITLTICLGYYKKIAKADFWCVNFPDGTGRVADNKPTHWRYRYIAETPQPPKGVE